MKESSSSVKRIVRASHDKENPYFLMRRATAQDKALSYEARGLIAYLLSRHDDWEVSIEDLCQECGRGRVYNIIKELLKANYLERIYHRDDRGRIAFVEYVVHEQPFTENPQMDNPKVEKPFVENRTQHNRDKKHKTENTTKRASKRKAKPALIPDVPTDVVVQYEELISPMMDDAAKKALAGLIGTYTTAWVQDAFTELKRKCETTSIENPFGYLIGILRGWTATGKPIARSETTVPDTSAYHRGAMSSMLRGQ